MKKYFPFAILVLLTLTFGCQSRLERFNADHETFKSENLEGISEAFNRLMAFEKMPPDTSLMNKAVKEAKLNLTDDAYNTLLIDQTYFGHIRGESEQPEKFHKFGDELFYVEKLVNGKEDQLWFLESIRKEGFEFDEFGGPLSTYRKFVDFAKKLPQIEYVLVNYPLPSVPPQLSYDGFYAGEVYSTVALFDFKSGEMLSVFGLYGTNSNSISAGSTTEGDTQELYSDLNDETQQKLEDKLRELYTVEKSDLWLTTWMEFMAAPE